MSNDNVIEQRCKCGAPMVCHATRFGARAHCEACGRSAEYVMCCRCGRRTWQDFDAMMDRDGTRREFLTCRECGGRYSI